MFFSFHYKLSEDQSIIWNQSKLTRPVLRSSDTWSVNLNFTSLLDKRSCGLERLNIRSMSKLSLSITSNPFIHPSCLNKLFLLFLSAHDLNAFDKHSQMYRSWSLLNWKIQKINNICFFIKIFSVDNERNLFISLLENLESTFVKDIEVRLKRLIFLKSLFQIIQQGLRIKEFSHFLNIESAFLPFLSQTVFNIHWSKDEC